MIRGLLQVPGVEPSMVTVYIDGFYDEPVAVAELFKLSAVEHVPMCSKNCRISQVPDIHELTVHQIFFKCFSFMLQLFHFLETEWFVIT